MNLWITVRPRHGRASCDRRDVHQEELRAYRDHPTAVSGTFAQRAAKLNGVLRVPARTALALAQLKRRVEAALPGEQKNLLSDRHKKLSMIQLNNLLFAQHETL